MNQSIVIAGVGHPGCKEAKTNQLSGLDLAAVARVVTRASGIVLFSLIALLEILVRLALLPATRRRAARAAWLHRWCGIAARVLGLCLTTKGRVPRSGLLVSNHLGYLDIIALSSLQPCVFVAKRDVRHWPLFGWLARAGGTIFVARDRRLSAAAGVSQIRAAIESGLLVVLFAEGTSSDGATVLPFRSSLLQAAVSSRCAIALAGITYSLAKGSVADEVCYWRDMTLLPHLLNLFAKSHIESTIRFAASTPRGGDRKTLAHELRAEVAALRR